jgi:hypothetical protein
VILFLHAMNCCLYLADGYNCWCTGERARGAVLLPCSSSSSGSSSNKQSIQQLLHIKYGAVNDSQGNHPRACDFENPDLSKKTRRMTHKKHGATCSSSTSNSLYSMASARQHFKKVCTRPALITPTAMHRQSLSHQGISFCSKESNAYWKPVKSR